MAEREKEGEWVSDDYRNDVNDDEDFAWLQGERREAFSSPPLSPAIRSGHLYLFREGRRKQWPDHNGLFTMNWNSCKFHPRPPSFELGIRVLRARWLGRSTIFQDLLRDEGISFYLLFLFYIYIYYSLFFGDENCEFEITSNFFPSKVILFLRFIEVSLSTFYILYCHCSSPFSNSFFWRWKWNFSKFLRWSVSIFRINNFFL